MSEIIYCANGCTRAYEGERIPITTDPPSILCRRCEDNLAKWLHEIPERYALLPEFIDVGSAPKDPDSKATKRTEAPAPMRLEIVDLLDTRRGRKWLGIIPTRDMRGAVGTLHVYAQIIREERNLTPRQGWPTVRSEASLIERHRLWALEQDWAGGEESMFTEIRTLHRDLGRALGLPVPRPVGTCTVLTETDDECGGPLLPSRLGGVYCARCHAEWDIDRLRTLGLLLNSPEQETA